MDQPGLGAPLGEDRLDAALFAERLVTADVLHGDAGLAGQALGVGSQLLAKRLGPARVVEQPDTLRGEARGHCTGMGDRGQVPVITTRSKQARTPVIPCWWRATKLSMVASPVRWAYRQP